MKNLTLFLLLIMGGATVLTSFSSPANPDPFYYAFQERVPLKVVENKVIVRYARVTSRAQASASLRASAGIGQGEAQMEWNGMEGRPNSGHDDPSPRSGPTAHSTNRN